MTIKRFVVLIALLCAACPWAQGRCVFRRPFGRVASIDPIRAADVASAEATALVYEPLLEVDYKARPYRLKECAVKYTIPPAFSKQPVLSS